jgi:hypothetical protein
MSVVLDAYCENFEELLEEHPELSEEDVSAGSQQIIDLTFGTLRNEYEDSDSNLFDFLEAHFQLENTLFKDLVEDDEGRVEVSGALAVNYLSSLLKILKEHESRIPSIFWFEIEKEGSFVESDVSNNLRLQAGYDYCVLINDEEESATDLRDENFIEIDNKKISINRQSVFEFSSSDFQGLLKVAQTAMRFNRQFILEVT